MLPETQEEYANRTKLFEEIAKCINDVSPLQLSDGEKGQDVIKLKHVVTQKMSQVIADVTKSLRATGVPAPEPKRKALAAPKLAYSGEQKNAVKSLSSLNYIQPVNVDLKVGGKGVVVFATDRDVDNEPEGKNILMTLDFNTLSSRQRKEHGIMANVNRLGPDPNKPGLTPLDSILSAQRATPPTSKSGAAALKATAPVKQSENVVSKAPAPAKQDILILD